MGWSRKLAKDNLRRLQRVGRRLRSNAQAVGDRVASMWEHQQRMFSVHIPKTGGTTFLTVLEHHFGNRLVRDYEMPRDEVNRMIGGRGEYCVHGHYYAEKYADVPDATFVTWMRDPIDQLISHYNFWANYRFPHDLTWRRVHYDQMDFMSFAKLRYISNSQARFLSGKPLDEFAFVGVTEMFTEGMELFRDQFGLDFDPAALPRLRDSRKFRSVFDRSMLSKKDTAILYDAHPLDTELYHKAVRHFRENSRRFSEAAAIPKSADASTNAAPAYGGITWGGQYLQPENEKTSFSYRQLITRRLAEAGITKIRGTYYFGDSWPVNTWDTFRPELADRLLQAVVDNGYNTIILLIPSGMELVQRTRPQDYDTFRKDLTFLLDRIRAKGLHYAYRIAYGWEGYPIEQNRGLHLFSLVSGGEIQQNFLNILADLWAEVKDDPLFLMAFSTWEDLISNPIHTATRATPERKKMMAKEIGFNGSEKGIPDLKDPEMMGYLEHVDDAYVEFMYRIKQVFPPVTLEVRVDHTPTYDAHGTMHPFIHHKQMIEVDTDVLGTYFGTYMMIGPTPRTAEQAIEGMERAHANTRLYAPQSKAFVDQFNFVMREKNFSQFEPLEVPEMRRFLDKMVDWFDDKTVGYATWSFVDYMMDIVSNSSFRLGMEGWKCTGQAALVDVPLPGQTVTCRQLALRDGATLTGTNIKHYSPWVKDGWIVLEADLDPATVLTVELSPDLVFKFTRADFAADGLGILPRLIRPFDGQTKGFHLSLQGGGARIARASMGSDVCSNGGLDVHFAENEVSQIVAAFNARIQEKSGDKH
jgi:hypothetical protein